MGQILDFFRPFRRRWVSLTKVQGLAQAQHGLLGFLFLWLTLPVWCVGLDWAQDARWELREPLDGRRFRLGDRVESWGLGDSQQDMFILPQGLLVRQYDGRAVNLTVLQGDWELLRDEIVLGRCGEAWPSWRERLGSSVGVYQKAGSRLSGAGIHVYQASMVDLGLLVVDDRVQSIMMVEPGCLDLALRRSGYESR